MTIRDPLITPLQEKTFRALESADPFNTGVPEPMRVDNKPVISEREPVQKDVQEPEPTPEPEVEIEVVPGPVAEKPKRGRKPKAAMEEAPEPEFKNPISESRTKDGLPSYRCEFSGRDIMLAVPCYKTTNPATAMCWYAMGQDFGKDKIRLEVECGDAMIYHTRNILAQRFIETDAKWLFMMDDDMIPSIGRPLWLRHWVPTAVNLEERFAQRHILHRLIGSGKTLIGGAYFGRKENAPLMCSERSLAPRVRAYDDMVAPVDWVGTGCLLIHRKVLDDIREKNPQLAPSTGGRPFNYFQPINEEMGEDVSFCKRAKEAGHQPHIDLGVPIFHVGYKCY